MKRFILIPGLLVSTLVLAAACKDDPAPAGTTEHEDGGDEYGTGGKGAGGKGAGGGSSTGGKGGASAGGTAAGGGSSTGGKAAGDSGAGGAGIKDGGGHDAMPGDAASPFAGICQQFCTDNIATCTGANKQYTDKATCLVACAKFDTSGVTGALTGNTLQCRVYHLSNAMKATPATSAADHCPHTGVAPKELCK